MPEQFIDLHEADHIEVVVVRDHNGTKLWVNVNGKCMFRAYRIKELEIDDNGKCRFVD